MLSVTIITNLLTNMVVLTPQNTIPTNTPAFQYYAFCEMFRSATNMGRCWNLDLPHYVETNAITQFRAVAYPGGIGGNIILSNRYFFSWLYGGLPVFDDATYSSSQITTSDVSSNDAVIECWGRTKNLLTISQAQDVAEKGLRSVGLSLETLHFTTPSKAHQHKYEDADGKVHPLPYFEFEWRNENDVCRVDVSGINGRIVHFLFASPQHLRFVKPTNYFEMLGLPTNAVFVHPRFTSPGEPPKYELREVK